MRCRCTQCKEFFDADMVLCVPCKEISDSVREGALRADERHKTSKDIMDHLRAWWAERVKHVPSSDNP